MSINTAAPKIPTTLPGSLTPEAISVRGALLERGLETPKTTNDLSRDQRYDVIRDAFGDIMRALGLDLRDDSLEETPHRIAKMYVDEVFSGLDYSKFPKITVIENKMNVEEMVCRGHRPHQHLRASLCDHRRLCQGRLYPERQGDWLEQNQSTGQIFRTETAGSGAIDPADLGGHADPARHRGCGRHHFCRALLRQSPRREGRQQQHPHHVFGRRIQVGPVLSSRISELTGSQLARVGLNHSETRRYLTNAATHSAT